MPRTFCSHKNAPGVLVMMACSAIIGQAPKPIFTPPHGNHANDDKVGPPCRFVEFSFALHLYYEVYSEIGLIVIIH